MLLSILQWLDLTYRKVSHVTMKRVAGKVNRVVGCMWSVKLSRGRYVVGEVIAWSVCGRWSYRVVGMWSVNQINLFTSQCRGVSNPAIPTKIFLVPHPNQFFPSIPHLFFFRQTIARSMFFLKIQAHLVRSVLSRSVVNHMSERTMPWTAVSLTIFLSCPSGWKYCKVVVIRISLSVERVHAGWFFFWEGGPGICCPGKMWKSRRSETPLPIIFLRLSRFKPANYRASDSGQFNSCIPLAKTILLNLPHPTPQKRAKSRVPQNLLGSSQWARSLYC